MNSSTGIHLKATESDPTPRSKRSPSKSSIRVPFTYNPSDDGTDENLLILLHGLGDTHVPFGKLGKSLRLPQTATLALRAPIQVPFLYEEAYQWYNSFDQMGDLLERPNPTVALDLIAKVLDYLITDCSWPPQNIHFFGFAQGGTVALESCLRWWKRQIVKTSTEGDSSSPRSLSPLGSAVTVTGPLLSHPTLSTICPTPLLVFDRNEDLDSALSPGDFASFKKGFNFVKEVKFHGQSMPRAKHEWQPIMEFWSEQLSKRRVEGLYEVISGR